jgi:histidyl-tRNA synthetase
MLALRPEYTAGLVRGYIENGLGSEPQPILTYSYGSIFRHENAQLGRLREFRQFNLEIMGTPKPIADAIIIRTTYDILEDFGLKDLVIDINSMGDKESRTIYIKELSSYYKKHISNMCIDCKNRLKNNPLRLLDCKQDECQQYKEKAPQSINYLSTDARKHFKELLQYLEEMNIPFRINPELVRGLDYYARTVFEVVQTYTDEHGTEKKLTICGGGRYDLSKNLGSKKDIPSVGTALGFDRISMMPDCNIILPKIIKPARCYFIQLGFDAKLKSLNIMEILRKGDVPVYQNLSKDTLGSQLAAAEKMEVPYAIIFGQKEAMDNTVIIRDMVKQSQEIIKIENLCAFIKKLK